MGIVLFGPGLAIETVTDFPLWASILAVASSAIVYTAAGGLRAVVWTDVFQMFIMLLGIFSVMIKTTVDVGGFKKVFDIARDGDRLIMPSFDPDPTVRNTFWSLVVGSSISLQYLLTTQTTVQRICSVPTVRDARKVIIISTLATVMNYVLSCLLGLFVYAYFHETRCDPIASKTIKNPNQILPLLVVTIFHDLPGLSGVFVAALLSASLSSISSVLSSLSAQTVEDIVKPMVKDLSESRATLIAKIAVFIYGFIGIAISFMIANIKGPLTQITVSMLSSFGGACSGMFLFAAFCPWANYKGTIVGGITGMTLVLWISLGKSFSTTLAPPPRLPPAPVDMCLNTTHNREDMMTSLGSVHNVTDYPNNNTYITEHSHNHGLDVLYSISYFWMTPLTILVTFILGTIVSVLSGRPNPSEVDVKYLLPFFDYCFPCLPERLKNVLHCGADFGKSKMKLERAEIKIESEILAFATEELD
ncbi:sodium-dependent multivitamin transporter-like [Argopecten irradians]|uniref:sodium-dependent multivitamin transporter-like n=1 Tax=Argopecten irradians TaxID=31199 RepID=UPI003713CEEE